MTRPGSHASADPRPPFPERPLPYVWHYLMRRRVAYGAIFVLTVAAALCAVAVQYGMRLLVDAMACRAAAAAALSGRRFVLFIGLIAIESVLWRLAGWLGSRTIVASSASTCGLTCSSTFPGSRCATSPTSWRARSASRITAAGSAFHHILSALVWNIIPPCTDFLVARWSSFDRRLADGAGAAGLRRASLPSSPCSASAAGRLHHRYAEEAGAAGGELVDAIANMWALKAFSARSRERDRLARR